MEDMLANWSEDLVAKRRRLLPTGLAGKLLTQRSVNKKAFSDTIRKLWRVTQGMEIKVLADNHFLFTFEDAGDVERILDKEPWSYNRALLVLKKFEGFSVGDLGSFQSSRIWVRAFNLPLACMISDIGMLIGDAIGVGVSVEADREGRCLGLFLRMRVLVDISKPLRRIVRLVLGSSGQLLTVALRYERLPDYCYSCGLLGHVARDCGSSDFDPEMDQFAYPYGPWLRAEVDLASVASDCHGSSALRQRPR